MTKIIEQWQYNHNARDGIETEAAQSGAFAHQHSHFINMKVSADKLGKPLVLIFTHGDVETGKKVIECCALMTVRQDRASFLARAIQVLTNYGLPNDHLPSAVEFLYQVMSLCTGVVGR